MQDLLRKIAQIGEQLVKCDCVCEGTKPDRSSGVLPRCLFLQLNGSTPRNGCAIIGINPGTTDEKEKTHYIKNRGTYTSIRQYFIEEIVDKKQYYIRLRKLANAMGYGNAVLWTELAKCENVPDYKGRPLPLQTFRKCSSLYLSQELKHVPKDWPLVGVGHEAYKALAYLHPKRSVLGVPHPTGARGNQWHGLFDGDALKPEILKSAKAAISDKTAVWLGRRGTET